MEKEITNKKNYQQVVRYLSLREIMKKLNGEKVQVNNDHPVLYQ